MDLEPLRAHSHEQVWMYVDAKTFYKELNDYVLAGYYLEDCFECFGGATICSLSKDQEKFSMVLYSLPPGCTPAILNTDML